MSKSKNLKSNRSSQSTLLHSLLPVRILWICIAILMLAVTVGTAEELTPEEELGKKLFFDKISEPDWMSCATCHAPETGFTGPIPGINKYGAVYRGAVPQRFGNRKPPSAAYATLSPVFHIEPGDVICNNYCQFCENNKCNAEQIRVKYDTTELTPAQAKEITKFQLDKVSCKNHIPDEGFLMFEHKIEIHYMDGLVERKRGWYSSRAISEIWNDNFD